MVRIGVDLGGTKIEIIALAPDGSVLLRKRVATPHGDYDATLDCLRELVREAQMRFGVSASVGVGIPGALSQLDGRVKNANSTVLIGKPLKEDLQCALGCEVRLENDANCFALSEATDGAGAGARVVFGVILGTGVGGGIVVEGRLIVGANAIAGESGHNPLPLPDIADLPLPPCYCGRQGCIETYLSGPALRRDHLLSGGVALQPEEMAERAAQGDAQCEATLARYEERLARSLAGVINILDPDVIVLGGGVSNISRLYERVPALWLKHVFSDRVVTRLARNQHGDSSGVRGAAWLQAGVGFNPRV